MNFDLSPEQKDIQARARDVATNIVAAEARAIDEQEARVMVRRLAREEGVFVGTSSGLNIVAAIELARELGPGKVVATVAVDSGLKYLAGDLFSGA